MPGLGVGLHASTLGQAGRSASHSTNSPTEKKKKEERKPMPQEPARNSHYIVRCRASLACDDLTSPIIILTCSRRPDLECNHNSKLKEMKSLAEPEGAVERVATDVAVAAGCTVLIHSAMVVSWWWGLATQALWGGMADSGGIPLARYAQPDILCFR